MPTRSGLHAGSPSPSAPQPAHRRVPPWRWWQATWRRWSLWVLLVSLVASMLATLVWLAGRYETSEVQGRLERDAADAVTDLRRALAEHLQRLRDLPTLPANTTARNLSTSAAAPVWHTRAERLLASHHELLGIEWRDAQLRVGLHAQTPHQSVVWDLVSRSHAHSETMLACANARRMHGPAYSSSYFMPLAEGLGSEVLEVCLPQIEQGQVRGFVVATYTLHGLLQEVVAPGLQRTQGVAFTEADGTRLALVQPLRRGLRLFVAKQLLDLPGATLVLRMEGWHQAPSLFPNVLTALVSAMSIALVSVLVVLVRDNRRRLRAERDLGEALAFRKAMEDSLLTGLRARDLEGRITYVNPAFCEMVGFAPQELLGQSRQLPYWPPEHAENYAERQAVRMAGDGPPPPREGYESLFMHKNGQRFAVMIYEAPLINAQGQHTGWMGSFLDVSEQRRAEELSRTTQERLQASARLAMVGEMASLISHELNQPLAVISSYANGLLNLLPPTATTEGEKDGCATGPPLDWHELRQPLERIAQQAERAGRVIKSVHDFVRRREHRREAVSAQELLEAVLPLIRLQAGKLGVQVHLELEADLPAALCDRTMVEQVLLNLARNAMQAMDEPDIQPRVLHLRVRRALSKLTRRWLEFSVADVGLGIDPEVARRLFTPLFTTRAEGMGLGLSLCRTVVEQHGGYLGHGPNTPRGTVFTFTLPSL